MWSCAPPGPADFADDSVTFSWEPSRRSRRRSRATLLPDPEPRPIRVPVISVDDHLIEPPDLFEGRLPAALGRGRPAVVEQDDGTQSWVFEGNRYPNVGLNAVVGRPREEWSMEPARFDEMRPGCFDIDARIVDMDRAGIWASLCFPSLVSGFCGAVYSRRTTRSSAWPACAPSTTGTWRCGPAPHPDRIIPLQLPWLADVEVAGAEVRANAARGFKAVSFPEFPAQLRLPSIFSGAVGPLLRRLRGDRHGRVPAHRGVVVGAAPLARPALRAAAHPLPGERAARGRRVAVVGRAAALPGPAGRPVRGRHRLGARC